MTIILIIIISIIGVLFLISGSFSLNDKEPLYPIALIVLGLFFIIVSILVTRMNTIEQIEKYVPNIQEQIVEGKILELENQLESKNDNSKSN